MAAFTVQLSEHAVERFRTRVRPGLSVTDAEDQLAHLALFADVVTEPPEWFAASTAQLAPWYLVLADVVLPLKPHWVDPEVLVATTCVTRGGSEAAARRRRERRRAALRASGRRRHAEVA